MPVPALNKWSIIYLNILSSGSSLYICVARRQMSVPGF